MYPAHPSLYSLQDPRQAPQSTDPLREGPQLHGPVEGTAHQYSSAKLTDPSIPPRRDLKLNPTPQASVGVYPPGFPCALVPVQSLPPGKSQNLRPALDVESAPMASPRPEQPAPSQTPGFAVSAVAGRLVPVAGGGLAACAVPNVGEIAGSVDASSISPTDASITALPVSRIPPMDATSIPPLSATSIHSFPWSVDQASSRERHHTSAEAGGSKTSQQPKLVSTPQHFINRGLTPPNYGVSRRIDWNPDKLSADANVSTSLGERASSNLSSPRSVGDAHESSQFTRPNHLKMSSKDILATEAISMELEEWTRQGPHRLLNSWLEVMQRVIYDRNRASRTLVHLAQTAMATRKPCLLQHVLYLFKQNGLKLDASATFRELETKQTTCLDGPLHPDACKFSITLFGIHLVDCPVIYVKVSYGLIQTCHANTVFKENIMDFIVNDESFFDIMAHAFSEEDLLLCYDAVVELFCGVSSEVCLCLTFNGNVGSCSGWLKKHPRPTKTQVGGL